MSNKIPKRNIRILKKPHQSMREGYLINMPNVVVPDAFILTMKLLVQDLNSYTQKHNALLKHVCIQEDALRLQSKTLESLEICHKQVCNELVCLKELAVKMNDVAVKMIGAYVATEKQQKMTVLDQIVQESSDLTDLDLDLLFSTK
jgi:hypothetical protein